MKKGAENLQGQRIRELRLERGLSQEELGKLVGGVGRAAVNKWEVGLTRNLRRDVIERLSEIFNVSPAYIMGMTDDRSGGTYEIRRVPMLGQIAAGQPIMAHEEHGEYVVVDTNLRVDFCLRVRGDSMIAARIHDGDVVFVRSQPTVENGEIAVIMIDGEVTLKRVYITQEGLILKPENSKYAPIFVPKDDGRDVRILGKAVMFQSLL